MIGYKTLLSLPKNCQHLFHTIMPMNICILQEAYRYWPSPDFNKCKLISVDIPYRFAIQYLVLFFSKTDTPDHLFQKYRPDIQFLRKSNKMTLQGLSDQTGINLSSLWFIENGQRNLHILTLKKIADVFKRDIKDFI